MHIIAAKAVAFGEALRPEFKEYAGKIVSNCKVMADELLSKGFKLVSGGTENHMVLVDFTGTDVTGAQAEIALGIAGITVNKNSIPFDPKPAAVTSGIRLGTPAITSRGFRAEDTRKVARLMAKVLNHIDDQNVYSQVRDEVNQLNSRFLTPGITA